MDPFENPDWDYARARKVMVRSPVMEWSSSVSSVHVELPGMGKFVVPNRNMPVDGLTVLLRGELWKAIDGVGISVDGEKNLVPSSVHFSVGLARYEYTTDDGSAIKVEYAPADPSTVRAGGLKLRLALPEKLLGHWFNLFFLVDLRPLKRPPQVVDLHPGLEAGLLASSSGVNLGVSCSLKIDHSHASASDLPWVYKQGYGFRKEVERGIVFVPEERTITVVGPYRVMVSSSTVDLMVTLSDTWPLEKAAEHAMASFSSSCTSQLGAVLSRLPEPQVGKEIRDALYGRMAALLSFGIRTGNTVDGISGEAGAHWFRETWFRDVFEGLLWDIKTLAILDLPGFIRSQLELGFAFADPSGLIPNNLTWTAGEPRLSYESIDSTLLFHHLLLEYGETFGDSELLARGISSLERFVRAVANNAIPAIRMYDGALLTPPHYGWVDSRSDLELDGIHLSSIPCRVPVDWLRAMLSEGLSPRKVEAKIGQPSFLMPEIQARLTLVLRRAKGIAAKLSLEAGTLDDLERRSANALETHLMSKRKGLLPNLVMFEKEGTRVDTTPSSPSFSALSLLKDTIPLDMLQEGYSQARAELLVSRRMKSLGSGTAPFGLIAQKRRCEPYFDDKQYHGCVVWPKESPYLADVMRKLGLVKEVNGLLLNHLDASVSEGIPFYASELYGLPLGRNPTPTGETANQVIPLKNPAQFWSTWLDPYLVWFVS